MLRTNNPQNGRDHSAETNHESYQLSYYPCQCGTRDFTHTLIPSSVLGIFSKDGYYNIVHATNPSRTLSHFH